jgi:hypothetical protein
VGRHGQRRAAWAEAATLLGLQADGETAKGTIGSFPVSARYRADEGFTGSIATVTVTGLPRGLRIWGLRRPHGFGTPGLWSVVYDRVPWLGDGRMLQCDDGTKVILSRDTEATDRWLEGRVEVVCSMNSTLEWSTFARHHYLELRSDAFSKGVSSVFLWAVPFALAGLVIVLLMPELPLRDTAHIGSNGPPPDPDTGTGQETVPAR